MSPDSAIRVLHVIHDLRRGGAEHVLVDLAAVAPAAGLDMTVVSMRPVESFEYARELTRRGVDVVDLDLAGWWDPRGPGRIRRVISNRRPDVVHSHLKHADVIAGRVAARAGIPHVSTLHLIEADRSWVDSRKRDIATRSRVRTAARTVAVSEAVKDWYVSTSGTEPSSVVTIPNGVPDPGPVDGETVARTRAEIGADPDSVVVVMVAVMRPGKGHDVLLDALPYIADDSVIVVLAGDGPAATRLRERASHESRVQFLGFRDDVTDVLAAADLVVHPTFEDALPTALVHALAAAKPIVASDVGGVPEIVGSDGGVLVPPGDVDALADAISDLASDPDARHWMGKQNRERYDQTYRADVWATRLRSLYEELVE